LIPLFQFTLPSFAILIAIEKIAAAICSLALIAAGKPTCSAGVPTIATITLVIFALIGLAACGWRFYKDYICHERFDDELTY
jgi:hypothetical protein